MAAVRPSKYAADRARDESAAIRQKLNGDIKNGTPEQIYLLYGEEAFLRRSYRNRLKELITGGDEMNYAYFEGAGIDVSAVIDLAQTMPFFAERRLIVVENSGWFSGKDASALVKTLEELPETTYLIFSEESIDKRMVFTKKVLERGFGARLDYQSYDDLCRWAVRKAKAAGKDMQPAAARLLVERVGNDMNALSNEIDKLIAYRAEESVLTAADVEAIGSVRLNDRLFDMVDAAVEGRTRAALDIYADLLALKEAPLKMMIICGRHLAALMTVKEMVQTGASDRDIAQAAGLRDFQVKKYRRQERQMSMQKLTAMLDRITELDASIKTGTVSDQLAVELFITELGRR
ncbi:MAG: DNA polymerase III subunit delta [Lachnospiraceae bacterium]|nr:DNA polymerase III subunit delta [Lachnospiraceae bacterium]